MAKDPKTRDEWYEAVNAAAFFLLMHDCQLYGLVEGPSINVERCEQIIERARRLKIPVLPMGPEELIKHYARRKING